MAHEYDYNSIPNEELRKRKAVDDVRFWLGKNFKAMSDVIKKESRDGMSRKMITININMFLGIQGYPVEIWLDELGVPKDPEQTPNNPSGTAETQAPDSKVG